MVWWRVAGRKIGFMRGDVRVIGLVAGTHVIEDIGMDVPYGVTVTIPGDLAVRSKDLWRAISQKCIFQQPTAAPPPQLPPQAQAQAQALDMDRRLWESEKKVLEARVRELEAQIRLLEVENRVLQQGSNQDSLKLDSILSALQNSSRTASGSTLQPTVKRSELSEVADGSAPTFLPSEIRPKDVDARIDVQSESAASDVSNAAGRLRKMRRGV